MKKILLTLALIGLSLGAANADTFTERFNAFTVAENDGPAVIHATFVKTCDADGKNCQTVDTAEPATFDAVPSPTSKVKGGEALANIIAYLSTAFGVAIATLVTGSLYKLISYLGIQVTQQQRDQLQSIVVNGLNDAAAKAEVSLKNNPNLDINVKNKIIADTITYTQDHAKETIKALGLDAKDGQAVEAIRARVATALNDPNTPTPPAITPLSAGGNAL